MFLPVDFTKYWACDIEGNPIPSTRIWVVCCYNLATHEKVTLHKLEEIREWFETKRQEGCKFVFHNGLQYDGPTLNRIAGTKLSNSNLIDTMLMSMVYSPSLDGGHGLEMWGRRLNHPKGDWTNFDEYHPDMDKYCMNDAILCGKVFRNLVMRMRKIGFSERGLDLEHRAWSLIHKQHNNGFAFNIQEAHVLYSFLREKEKDLERNIHRYWPPKLEKVASFARAFKKDGSPSANYTRHREQYVKNALS